MEDKVIMPWENSDFAMNTLFNMLGHAVALGKFKAARKILADMEEIRTYTKAETLGKDKEDQSTKNDKAQLLFITPNDLVDIDKLKEGLSEIVESLLAEAKLISKKEDSIRHAFELMDIANISITVTRIKNALAQ